MDKDGTKQVILAEAIKQFLTHGIKNVKMDDIAQALHISKRTVYELFPNKEELLYTALSKFIDDEDKKRAEMVAECNGDILKILYHTFRVQTDTLPLINPLFYEDIAFYPRVKAYLNKHHNDERKGVMRFFREGVKQGVFRKDVDYKLFLDVVEMNKRAFMKEKFYLRYPMIDFFRSFTLVQFRGLLTDEARSQIKHI